VIRVRELQRAAGSVSHTQLCNFIRHFTLISSCVPLHVAHFESSSLLYNRKSLRHGKAPGPSQLPVDFYKNAQAQPDVLNFLLQQVNLCLSGARPITQDDCKLVHIFKKGSRSDPSNWRPINLTNVAFRVCEAVIYRRLLTWSESVLGDRAFGFCPGRRAEDVGYLLAHNLHRANHSRRPAHLLSLDISKAFDTVPHDLLLLSLARAGLSSASVKILASMLLGHKCIVGDPSTSRHFVIHIRRGVLQGGILTPLLFNILFDQSLPTSFPDVLPLSYADDVSAIHIGPAPLSEPSSLSRHHLSLLQQRTAARSSFLVSTELAGSSDFADAGGHLPSAPPHSLPLQIMEQRLQKYHTT
jgi:hypothetical protein